MTFSKIKIVMLRRITAHKAIIYLILLKLLQTAHSAYCPAPCDCQFHNKVSKNAAICSHNDTTLYMQWRDSSNVDYRPELTITCKGTKEFGCLDTPQFDIEFYQLKVKSCPSSLLKCVNQIPKARIVSVETEDVFGGYTEETFAGLDGAREFRLNLRGDDSEFPKAAISTLKSLVELYVTGGDFEVLPNEFSDLPLLGVMELNHNNISVLSADSLNGLRCKKLNIIRNYKIENISAGTFQVIGHLQELQISANKLKHVEPGAFASTTLTHLRLRNNDIEDLPNGFLDGMPKLEELNILLNDVDIMLGSHVFASLSPSVKEIQLYGFKIHNLTDTTFLGATNLQTLNMQETKIEELPRKIFWDLISLTVLNLSGNRLKYIPADVFSRLVKLESIKLNSNRLTMLSDNQFSWSPNLKMIQLIKNDITALNMTSFNGTHVQSITLSGNGLEIINGDTSFFWRDLNRLDLANNKLRTFEDFLYGLPKLEYVDLTNNEITSIRENKTFFLSAQVTLDLRRNQISHVSRDPKSLNDGIKRGHFVLYLSNNPLQCDCTLLTVLYEWINADYLRHVKEITCSDKQFFEKINFYLFCNNKREWLSMIGSGVGGAIIILTILYLILSNRGKIWSCYLNVIQKQKSSYSE